MALKNPNQKPVTAQLIYECGGEKIATWHRNARPTRRLLIGAFGCGKSYALIFEILYMILMGKYQGKTVLFVARDHSQAVNNVLKKIVLPMIKGDADKKIPGLVKGSYKYTTTAPAIIEFWNGSRIVFLSHNSDAIDGWNASIVCLDEANKASEDLYLSLENRIGREGVPGKFLIGANPTHKGHWLYTRFWKDYDETGEFPEDTFGVSLSLYDSKHVSAARKKAMEQAYSHSKALFERAVLGNFSDNSGQVYASFDPDIHVLTVAQQPIIFGNDKMRITCGLDFGFRDPTAFLMVAYNTDNGCYYVFKEYKKGGEHIAVHAKEILRQTSQFPKRPIIYSEHESQTRAEYAAHGINTTLANKELLPGINAIATLFAENRLFIFDSCKELKREIEGYQWKEKGVKEMPIGEDHLNDCLRYSIYSVSFAGSTKLYLPFETPVGKALPDNRGLKIIGVNLKGEPVYGSR